MKNLLNRLTKRRKKTLRASRILARNVSATQIFKMGRLGQSLIVMSR